MKLLIATQNSGKFNEIKKFLDGYFKEFYYLKDFPDFLEVDENGNTFCENSLKKALHYSKFVDFYVLGDDSGLMVDYLNGFPGVYSSRWAGENLTDKEKYEKLLEKMAGIPFEKRSAKFVSCITFVLKGKEIFSVTGECKGYILEKPVGEGGFGYDPLFYLPEYDKTFAELNSEEKNRISHRGQALKKFLEKLKDINLEKL